MTTRGEHLGYKWKIDLFGEYAYGWFTPDHVLTNEEEDNIFKIISGPLDRILPVYGFMRHDVKIVKTNLIEIIEYLYAKLMEPYAVGGDKYKIAQIDVEQN